MSDTDIELLTMSKKIKQEANEILKIFNISEILKNFKLEIIGSYKLDLMYDRDLDQDLKSLRKFNMEILLIFLEIIDFLAI